MIDYLSLAIGHGLLAIALLRLVMRGNLDADPHLARLSEEKEAMTEGTSVAARNARRRRQREGGEEGDSVQNYHDYET